MKRRDFVISTCTSLAGLSLTANGSVQQKIIQPDLFELAENKSFQVFNRSLKSFSDGALKGVIISEALGDGVAYLPHITLADGTIEFDLKGKDVFQRSFVGVAFHGVDGVNFDAIYFRPFNFRAEDVDRRQHAVQYIANPTYSWSKLRADHPGKYEGTVKPVPDPNDWFHARVVLRSPTVSVSLIPRKNHVSRSPS